MASRNCVKRAHVIILSESQGETSLALDKDFALTILKEVHFGRTRALIDEWSHSIRNVCIPKAGGARIVPRHDLNLISPYDGEYEGRRRMSRTPSILAIAILLGVVA